MAVQSQIDDLKKLAEVKNNIRTLTVAQKISRQQNLSNLEELYRPLLSGQTNQLNESKTANIKIDETKTSLENIIRNLEANGDLTNASSELIVKKLNKLDTGVLKDILRTVEQKPEAIALLQILSEYPNVAKAIKDDDATGLNKKEIKIFNGLRALDERTLSVLVDYYSNIKPIAGDVFVSEVNRPVVKEEFKTPPPYHETEFEASNADNFTYTSTLADLKNRNLEKNIGFWLHNNTIKIKDDPVLFNKNNQIKLQDSDVSYNYTVGLRKLLSVPNLNVLAKINVDISKDDVHQWLAIIKESGSNITAYREDMMSSIHGIKLNTALQKIDELKKYYPNAKPYKGKGFSFLPSDPEILFKRLSVLIAEKQAGNNNVFEEISAISDELRRAGVLSIKQLKKLYRTL